MQRAQPPHPCGSDRARPRHSGVPRGGRQTNWSVPAVLKSRQQLHEGQESDSQLRSRTQCAPARYRRQHASH
eukprot:6912526-Prymnesium_polylepis.1